MHYSCLILCDYLESYANVTIIVQTRFQHLELILSLVGKASFLTIYNGLKSNLVFSIPKILHIIRTAPHFLSKQLKAFDGVLRSFLSSILNIDLTHNTAWLQGYRLAAGTPPGCKNLSQVSWGLGVHRAVQLAHSASAAGCSAPIKEILPPPLQGIPDPNIDLVISVWSLSHSVPPLASPDSYCHSTSVGCTSHCCHIQLSCWKMHHLGKT